MLSMGVCINTHWQTSGRLVQEVKVCTGRISKQHRITLQNGMKLLSPFTFFLKLMRYENWESTKSAGLTFLLYVDQMRHGGLPIGAFSEPKHLQYRH